MIVWGDDLRRERVQPTTWDSPMAVAASVVWLVILLWLGPRALGIETATERADTAAHVAAIAARSGQ